MARLDGSSREAKATLAAADGLLETISAETADEPKLKMLWRLDPG